ncbi:flagellar protein FlaG [Clostridium folliculivorans]|uniref:Flagellar protein FlaG n=1 Tax=Clostridium folliculivorans TaxID=2886038 RepID=A0A9W5XYZ0_9CLOT|nr:flagellar protein FlaG [Clostridium folliculivorans]GKU23557.1 flagellar protein FlaG [Clostridium folliculivorans]GKU29673.1 flagellar protein FlaG [Clostridium folliculivorans]
MEIRVNQGTGIQTNVDSTNQPKPIITDISVQEDKKTIDTKDKNDDREIKKAVDKLNKFLEGDSAHAVYEMHDKFKNDLMIKIVDDKTKEVLMEVPPKKILDMVAKLCEMVGVVFDKKV